MPTAKVLTPAQRGAKLLDMKRPGWWKDQDDGGKINLRYLQLESGGQCILGQEYRAEAIAERNQGNGFMVGRHKLNIVGEDSYYGFSASGGMDEYRKLTAEWKEIIEARRKKFAIHKAKMAALEAIKVNVPEWIDPNKGGVKVKHGRVPATTKA